MNNPRMCWKLFSPMRSVTHPLALGLALLAALWTSAALAHHGWSWAQDQQMELTGEILELQIAPPHPWLEVQTDEGTWRVELGNPRNTERSGFNQDSASVGDSVTAIGNRSKDQSELRMKAVQMKVNDKTYDIYPERIQ